MPEFEKAYDPQKYEDEIYRTWEKSGYFSPDNLPGERKETFSMVLPPPNVTGTLHTGHALTVTIEDIMVRYQRMKGKRVLWVPGTDHAAIATETKVERELLKKEKKTRRDLGKEKFLQRVRDFAQESQNTILNQLRKMGASVDWTQLAFTLDEKRQKAVYEAFKQLDEAGLIIFGEYIVNWDPKGQTTVSDEEIVEELEKGTLYTFRYDRNFPIPIATTRPETKLGDVAVAVHPDDQRYQKYIGQSFSANFVGVDLKLKVVGDTGVDPSYGTGAVGVTPAHSKIDLKIARRHGVLPKRSELVQVINEKDQILFPDNWQGQNKLKVREEIISRLKNEGLLEKEDVIEHLVPKAQRTGGNIEFLPKRHQFFVDVDAPIRGKHQNKTLKELMREPVENNQIEFTPERFKKVYLHWIDNLHDWNISRQVWYGHPIPAWYRDRHEGISEFRIALESPGEDWKKIEDTFDTWFSSGLWTFSTLGWPDRTEKLEKFHPMDILETGYDILFFWVARMILMSTFLLGEVPFKKVYLHGLVRDEERRKMSKSLGNVIDPLEYIEEFGTDALRMALIVGNAPGSDLALGKEKVKAYKHFANKMWNATRFIMMNFDGFDVMSKPVLSENDQKILGELSDLVKDVTADIDNFRFHLASEKLYHYFWHTFADKIIESEKTRLKSDNAVERAAAQYLLYTLLTTQLKLLHPFMPFITEVIWEKLPHEDKKLLMIESWPLDLARGKPAL